MGSSESQTWWGWCFRRITLAVVWKMKWRVLWRGEGDQLATFQYNSWLVTVMSWRRWISRTIKGMDLARLGDLLGWGQVRICVTHSSLLYFRLWANGRMVVIYWGLGQWGKGWRACGWRAVRNALHVITSDLCADELFPPQNQFLGVRVS